MIVHAQPGIKPKRRPMTKARKRRIWEFHNRCCGECGYDVEMEGKGVVYDHRIPLEMDGPDDDGPNVRPICKRCDQTKTAADIHRIARAKRISAKHTGMWRTPKRRLSGRGFDKTKRRRMSGAVEARG